MNAMEEKHLTIETFIDGKRVDKQDIHDPFLWTKTTLELSMLDRIKLLWTGRVLFEVKVRGDGEAHRQWFRTDPIPGDEHEQQTTQALSNAADGEQPAPVDGARD